MLPHQVPMFSGKIFVQLPPPDVMLCAGFQWHGTICWWRLELHSYKDVTRIINNHHFIFQTQEYGLPMPTKLLMCVCLSVWAHLEFQCIESVFGGAAEWTLSDHLHRVEQLVAMNLQRTFHVYGRLADQTGAIVHQLEQSDRFEDTNSWYRGIKSHVKRDCERLAYLIDLLKLGPNVLLFPQTLTDAPIGRGKDDFVWARNTAAQKTLLA